MKKEVEVFGVTYDRYVLLQLHKILTAELKLRRILEMPSHGAKAAGSLIFHRIWIGRMPGGIGEPGDGDDVRVG